MSRAAASVTLSTAAADRSGDPDDGRPPAHRAPDRERHLGSGEHLGMAGVVRAPHRRSSRAGGDERVGEVGAVHGREFLRAVAEHRRQPEPGQPKHLEHFLVARPVDHRWADDRPGQAASGDHAFSRELAAAVLRDGMWRLVAPKGTALDRRAGGGHRRDVDQAADIRPLRRLGKVARPVPVGGEKVRLAPRGHHAGHVVDHVLSLDGPLAARRDRAGRRARRARRGTRAPRPCSPSAPAPSPRRPGGAGLRRDGCRRTPSRR